MALSGSGRLRSIAGWMVYKFNLFNLWQIQVLLKHKTARCDSPNKFKKDSETAPEYCAPHPLMSC